MTKLLTITAILMASTASAHVVEVDSPNKGAMGCEIKPIIGERTGNILYWNKVDPNCDFFWETDDDDESDPVLVVDEEEPEEDAPEGDGSEGDSTDGDESEGDASEDEA